METDENILTRIRARGRRFECARVRRRVTDAREPVVPVEEAAGELEAAARETAGVGT